jgi:hypothetical protein
MSNNSKASKKESPSHQDGLSTGAHGTKDNSECASRRIGNLPKVEKVRELAVEGEKGVAAKQAADQNSSLAPDGKRVQNVVPSGADFPSRVD